MKHDPRRIAGPVVDHRERQHRNPHEDAFLDRVGASVRDHELGATKDVELGCERHDEYVEWNVAPVLARDEHPPVWTGDGYLDEELGHPSRELRKRARAGPGGDIDQRSIA